MGNPMTTKRRSIRTTKKSREKLLKSVNLHLNPNNRFFCVGPLIHKGGPGKTTTLRMLASFIARYVCPNIPDGQPKKLLIVDLDPQLNTTSYYLDPAMISKQIDVDGIKRKEVTVGPAEGDEPSSIYDLFDPKLLQHPLLYPTAISEYIDIVPGSGAGFQALEKVPLSQEKAYVDAFVDWTHSDDVKDEYIGVLIDTPPSTNILAKLALHAYTDVYIPFEVGESNDDGVDNASSMIQTAKINRPTDKPTLNMIGLIANKVQENAVITDVTIQDYKNDPVYGASFIPFMIPQTINFKDLENPDNGTLFDNDLMDNKVLQSMIDASRHMARGMGLIL